MGRLITGAVTGAVTVATSAVLGSGLVLAGPAAGDDPVYAPRAKVLSPRCLPAGATAARVRLDNRSSTSPVTFEVVRVRRGVVHSRYVTVPAGEVRWRKVRTRVVPAQALVHAFDAQIAGRVVRPMAC